TPMASTARGRAALRRSTACHVRVASCAQARVSPDRAMAYCRRLRSLCRLGGAFFWNVQMGCQLLPAGGQATLEIFEMVAAVRGDVLDYVAGLSHPGGHRSLHGHHR